MYKERDGWPVASAVWKNRALLPPLLSDGTGNSRASAFPTFSYPSTFLTHFLPIYPLSSCPHRPFCPHTSWCYAWLLSNIVVCHQVAFQLWSLSTSVVEKCQWTMLTFLNYVFAQSFGWATFPECCCKAWWASLACSFFFFLRKETLDIHTGCLSPWWSSTLSPVSIILQNGP